MVERASGRRRDHLVVLVVVGVLVFAAGGLVARGYYDRQRALVQEQVQGNLASIGKLKAEEIVRWRESALAQAEYMNVRKVGRVDVPPWLSGADPAAAGRVQAMLAETAKYRGFQRVVVCDPVSGRSLASDGTTATAHEIGAAQDALESDTVSMGEPYLAGSAVLIDVTSPLAYADGTRVGLVMSMDLRSFLYPFIQTWPIPSSTAETLLVRRDGDTVVYLNDLRFRKGAALDLRFPVTEKTLLAVRAVTEPPGLVTGTDYRGQVVLGSTQRIEGSDWALVAKMDEAEAYAPTQQAALVATAGIAALLLVLAAGITAAWRIQVASTLREKVALGERYAFLSRNANDGVLLTDADGRILEANQRAVDMYGYSPEELAGTTLGDLGGPDPGGLPGVDAQTVRDTGSLLVEAEHVRKDGSRMPVELSLRMTGGPGAERIVAVIRDITERLSAEAALRESEDRFRYVFEHSSVGKSLTRPDGEVHVNQAFLDMLGYTREEMAQRGTWQQLTHPDDVESTEKIVASLVAGEFPSARFEKRYVRKDGSVVWADISTVLRRTQDGAPDYFVTTVLDITDRRAAEDALKSLSARHEAILQSVPDIIAEVDADKVYTWVNDAGREFFGGDVVGHAAADYFLGEQDTYARVEPIFSGAADIVYIESRQRRRDGEERLLGWWCRVLKDEDGSPCGALSTGRDITLQRAADDELRAYRDQLEALVEDRTAELTAANERLGSANEELRSVNETLADTTEELASSNEELLTTNEQLTAVNAEQDSLNEELSAVNEELVTSNEELLVATAAKSQFLANMSHELRTPLNSVIGFAGVLNQGLAGELNDEQRHQLAMIKRSGQRLLALINDVLDLSRIEAGRFSIEISDTTLGELIDGVVDIARALMAEKDLSLTVSEFDRGISISSDPRRVQQVLINLLGNAVKFTDVGGATLSVDTTEPDIVTFTVSDTGVGIAPADLSAVFDEFVQIPLSMGKPEGTGLGLSISRQLAAMLGGTLTASSVVGEGSTFTLRLPRVHAVPAPHRGI
jgi:two-component system sensor histidine kinase/response regulator